MGYILVPYAEALRAYAARLEQPLRRRPHRSQTKHANRMARGLRRALVHDAGCVTDCGRYYRDCFAEGDLAYIPSWLKQAPGRSVSVPRSLRPFLGRRIGGGR